MRLARAFGLVCGVAVVAVAVHSWAVVSTGAALGTDLTVAAVAPGELALAPPGAVLQASGLQPGRRVEGRVRVRNITGVPVRVRLRALPSTRALDGALELDARAGARRLAAGPAGALRAWSARSLTLGVRASATLALSERLRRPLQGLVGDVTLELDAVAPGPS